jgi:hypothetical protein
MSNNTDDKKTINNNDNNNNTKKTNDRKSFGGNKSFDKKPFNKDYNKSKNGYGNNSNNTQKYQSTTIAIRGISLKDLNEEYFLFLIIFNIK